MAVTYKTPHKYQDSDVWFKYFTKIELVILALPAYIDFKLLTANFMEGGMAWFVSVYIAIIITVPFVIMAKADVPKTMPKYGAGIKCRKLAVRLVLYYIFKTGRTIYIKNYQNDEYYAKKK